MTNLYNTAGQVAAAVYSRLAAIRLDNGCETDIGREVKRGRRMLPADDAVPCIVVLEGTDDPTDRPGRMPSALIQQTYVIDGFDKCDPDNPNDQAHAMIRDIKRAIFAGDDPLLKHVSKVLYLGRDIGPRAGGGGFVQARVLIAVEFVEDLTAP